MTLDIRGTTELIQSNHWRVVLEDVEVLDGGRMVGGAYGQSGDVLETAYVTGGHVSDATIDFDLVWAHARGHYSGRLDSSGHLFGTTYDVLHPGSQATWSATRQF